MYNVDVLNATELYTLKWLKVHFMLYIYYDNKKCTMKLKKEAKIEIKKQNKTRIPHPQNLTTAIG